MFRNYFITALRNIIRNKIQSVIFDGEKEQFELLEPGMVFEYTYLEDTYNRQYLRDE